MGFRGSTDPRATPSSVRPNPPPFLDESIVTLLRETRDAGEAPLVAVVSLGRFGPSCGSARAWPTPALHDRRMPLTIQRQQAFVTLAGRLRKLRYKGGVPSSYRPGRGGSDFGGGRMHRLGDRQHPRPDPATEQFAPLATYGQIVAHPIHWSQPMRRAQPMHWPWVIRWLQPMQWPQPMPSPLFTRGGPPQPPHGLIAATALSGGREESRNSSISAHRPASVGP